MSLIQQALTLAESALFLSNPNPRVGCVLTDASGHVIGQGHTQAAGQAHAEVMALRQAQASGAITLGATAYVTLEPCAHHGRTPPCCDALIAAGVARVVVATLDPNPLVAGQGVARMRAAGIEVTVLAPDDPVAVGARELNIGFFSRMVRKQPWVRMKMAASLDGTTALNNGVSQWITGPAARADGHAWRARACAVLTGVGTVLEDDPMLDVREVSVPRQPHLVVVDSRLQTPVDARLFSAPSQGHTRRVMVYHAQHNPDAEAALADKGAALTCLPNATGKVDLPALLSDLGQKEINELHLEAGEALSGSFLREGLVDELLLYQAPSLLGQGHRLSNLGPFETLDQAISLKFHDATLIGQDLRVLARVAGRDAFLTRV